MSELVRPYSDAHLHLTACSSLSNVASLPDSMLCSSAFTLAEWQQLTRIEQQIKDCTGGAVRVLKAFGIHPQNPDVEMLSVMETLLSGNSSEPGAEISALSVPDAIGEAGYDFFTKVYEAQEKQQDEVWYGQLEFAEKYGKPLVVHLRHAVDRMFRDAGRLKKLPSVIFHSFPGSPLEAEALRKRGINAYFSFGKPVLNHRKSSIECVTKLPDDWLLFETDAPFQTLKNEIETSPADIANVFEAAAYLRKAGEYAPDSEGAEKGSGSALIAEIVRANFMKAFLLD